MSLLSHCCQPAPGYRSMKLPCSPCLPQAGISAGCAPSAGAQQGSVHHTVPAQNKRLMMKSLLSKPSLAGEQAGHVCVSKGSLCDTE